MLSKVFENEISLIKDKQVADMVKIVLDKAVPYYFSTVPASSSEKHHPLYTRGECGLVRHTKAAVRIARDLLNIVLYQHLNADNIYAALILHDTFKYGTMQYYSGKTTKQHPVIAVFEIRNFLIREGYIEYLNLFDTDIAPLIASHMGQWTETNCGIDLPLPKNESEWFVHICDYLASRPHITVEVE